jgi:small subunit ribosomal protein S21
MAKITVREGETIAQALRRFKREVRKEGIMDEIRKHEYYEKPSVVRKREEEQKKRRIKQRERYN